MREGPYQRALFIAVAGGKYVMRPIGGQHANVHGASAQRAPKTH